MLTRLSLLGLLVATQISAAEKLTPNLSFTRGAINSAVIERDGSRLAVYGAAEAASQVLVTHHRRDVVWRAKSAIAAGAKAVAPESERDSIENPTAFWQDFTTRRFHDYAQQSTKILGEPLEVSRWVKDGDVIEWQGLKIRVVDTPGYTRGAVSYLVEVNGKRVGFTGDLIYGDGQLFDLYSFQDAIPDAKIGGYHGYGSRLAELVASLKKLASEDLDLIVPARGPVIDEPGASIKKLISRVQAIYKNYLSTNALNWYFKEKRLTIAGQRVLGEGAEVELMPYSLHVEAPDWVWEQGTTRMLISDEGHGFMLDCGSQRYIDSVKKLMADGIVRKIDGIFVTHYHDDHTDAVQAAAEEFDCPVYATVEYEDILERPGAYHMPAQTANAIKDVRGMKTGEKLRWQEFELTFHYYPGQTFYHGGLFVRRNDEKPIFFIGDAFSPSGIDDYCVLNRNLAHDDSGYLHCLSKIRGFQEDHWLVNEHIPFVFQFSDKELDYLEERYRQRIDLLSELFPWDDPNYGIDEQWAVFYPYGVKSEAGKQVELEVRITNHSAVERTYQVTPRVAAGMKLLKAEKQLTLQPRASGKVSLTVAVPADAGAYIVTADVQSEGIDVRDWVEALIEVP